MLDDARHSAEPHRDHDEVLGQGLAAVHACSPERFGLAQDNWLAGIPQDNRASADWPSFYVERRLRPLLEAIAARGLASTRLRRGFDRVFAQMPALCGPSEPPARLHGDLWSGNAITDSSGAPVLIDPAVYGGHREIDLAMMKLFGGFSARCFDAYHEAYPLAEGHQDRVALYQLYPLLAHVRLFGHSYTSQLEHTLESLL
jgi:fructosamine-3-kinase